MARPKARVAKKRERLAEVATDTSPLEIIIAKMEQGITRAILCSLAVQLVRKWVVARKGRL
eukprot:scaffold195847_cov33-Tisochrysis_lutea.AAC.1